MLNGSYALYKLRRKTKMDNFGYIVLIVFIIVRIMIAAGLLYLIISEVRRFKKRRGGGKEGTEDANGKDLDRSHRS